MSASLNGVHPDLIAKWLKVQAHMASIGHAMVPVQGLRTAEYQHGLWLQGRHADGSIADPKKVVTHCDGYHTPSNHQARPDGYGHALDCAFVVAVGHPGSEMFDAHQPWATYGSVAKSEGLKWGGDFPPDRIDLDHIELP